MKISQNSEVPSDPQILKTFMDILQPIIRLNQIFGICPLEISGHNIKLRFNSSMFIHAVITLIILTIYFVYVVYQFICSFGRGRSVPEIVTMATWVAGIPIPIAMLILAIWKKDQFSHFFEKSNEFRGPLQGMMKCYQTQSYSRKLIAVYIILTFGSCAFLVVDGIRKPNMDIFVLAYIEEPSSYLIAISCLFQCYLVILKQSGCAFIEVLCCCIGASFQNTVNAIIEEMQNIVGVSSTPVYRQHKSSIEQNNQRINQSRQRRFAIAGVDFQRNLNLIITPSNDDDDLHRIPSVPKFSEYLNLPIENSFYSTINDASYPGAREQPTILEEGTGPIIIAIKKFNCISSMQSLLNCIFGPILALDIALLVLNSCLLLYLKINYLGSGDVHYIDGITFVGNCILYFGRLIVVFISLGNVHAMSIHFNDCVTTSLMHVKNPKALEINLILSHLTSQFANPSCFNAAGFFIFSRGSLLAVLSAIMTYVIFMLQAKM